MIPQNDPIAQQQQVQPPVQTPDNQATPQQPDQQQSQGTSQPDPTSAAATDNGKKLALTSAQPTQPQNQQPPKPTVDPAVQKAQQHASVVRTIAETLAGGKRFKTVIDPSTGTATKEPIHLSRGDIGMAIAMSAITGALSGLQAHGPNAEAEAAGMGFNATAQQRDNADKQQSEEAQQQFARQAQIAKTNFEMHNNAMTAGQKGFDANKAYVDQFSGLYKQLQDTNPAAIKALVPESDLIKYHVTKDNAIPVNVVPRTDPQTGRQAVDKFGVPQWDIDYAVVDPNVLMDLSDEDKAVGAKYGLPGYVNGDGDAIKLPQNIQLRLGTLLAQKSRIGALKLAEHDIQNYYDTLNKHAAGAEVPVWGLFSDLDHLADFIQGHEGGNSDDRNMRDNNPGNLKATSPSQKQDKDGFRIFDNMEEGRAELINQLQRDMVRMPNATPEQYFEHYSPNNAPGNGPGTSESYAAAARKAAGVSSLEDVKQTYKPTNLVSAVKNDPMLPDALAKFQAMFNRTGGYGQAIDELGKKDPSAAQRVSQLYGGRSVIDQFDTQRQMQIEQMKDRVKSDEQLRKQAEDRAAKEAEHYDTYRADAKSIAGDPNDPGSGDMFALDKLVSQRTADRPLVYKMIKEFNPNWNPEQAEEQLAVWKDFTTDKGKTSQGIQSFNAFNGHVADAIESNEAYRSLGRNVSDFLNKPITWWDQHAGEFGQQEQYARFKASLEPAKTEFMTFLENAHALTEHDKAVADSLLDPKQTPAQIESTLKQMARTAAIRMNTVNDRWKRVSGGRDYPDLLNRQSVDAIRLINDPIVTKLMGPMQSGGYIVGSSNMRGTPGKTVNELLGLNGQQSGPQGQQPSQLQYLKVNPKTQQTIGWDGKQWVDAKTRQPYQPAAPAAGSQ